MTIKAKENELTDGQRKYKLCYVEEIPEEYYGLDERSKELTESEGYKEYRKKMFAWIGENTNFTVEDILRWESENGYDKYNVNLTYKFYDTQDYKDGFTHWFHFTNDMEKQWGDEWSLSISAPYDNDTEVVRMPIRLPKDWLGENDNVKVILPNDYHTTDDISADMVNHHAMPWVWISVRNETNVIVKSVSIMAGDTPDDVFSKIKEVKEFINNSKK